MAGFSRKISCMRSGSVPRDLGRVEAAEALLQLERAGERDRHRHLLVEREADEQRERLARDQGIRLGVAGEVQHVGHGSILPRPGMPTSWRIRSRRPKSSSQEADRGRSERTPWLALGGVHIAVGALVAVVLAIAFVAYLIA